MEKNEVQEEEERKKEGEAEEEEGERKKRCCHATACWEMMLTYESKQTKTS